MAKSSALTRKLPLSPELADFMGKDEASRGEVMKALWKHIKANDLQDEDDRRVIHPDDDLRPVLGNKAINMMKMTGIVSKHIG